MFELGLISLHTTSFRSSIRPTGDRVRTPHGAEPPPRFHVSADRLLRLTSRKTEPPARPPNPCLPRPIAAHLSALPALAARALAWKLALRRLAPVVAPPLQCPARPVALTAAHRPPRPTISRVLHQALQHAQQPPPPPLNRATAPFALFPLCLSRKTTHRAPLPKLASKRNSCEPLRHSPIHLATSLLALPQTHLAL